MLLIYLVLLVDGTRVRFLVDTGASGIVLIPRSTVQGALRGMRFLERLRSFEMRDGALTLRR